jgi:flagellar M-ring protein FliF
VGGFLQTLQRLGWARVATIAGVTLAVIVFFAYLATRLTAANYGLLYADLDLKDSAQIVARLDTMGIPYQLKSDGSIVYVPTDDVPRARLAMAELGIPHNGSVGYELFDKSDGLGATSFQQGISEMRSTEGELARTIESISIVETARVHLVLPKRELFTRETQEPSASIVLRTRNGQSLSKQQVAAVLNLVASAVPGLKTSRISIIDQGGNLLARGNGGETSALFGGSTAEEQRTAYEQKLQESVEEMLARSLGYGHVRVDATVDMDFDRITTNQESFDPDGQVVRSTQSSSDTSESTQPPDQGVTVQANLPEGQAQPPSGNATNRSKDNKLAETTNYEISHKTINQVREAGVVRRLSVAVLVDGTYGADHKYVPRSDEELKTLTDLVQSAVGYDEKRGDVVKVRTMQFVDLADGAGEPPPFFLGMTKGDLFRLGEMLIGLVLAVLVILLVIRPLMNRMFNTINRTEPAGPALLAAPGIRGQLAGPAGSVAALPGAPGTAMIPGAAMAGADEDDDEDPSEAMINIKQVEGRVRASSMRKIGEIVEKHPEEAVAILRSWMYQTS